MADNVLFEVDASQIIAKLHLAGRQAIKHLLKDGNFVVNTGIVNDNESATPDNPKNVSFDLKNPTGEYEVGITLELAYHKTYELENTLNTLQELLAKTIGKNSSLSDKDNKSAQESINKLTSQLISVFTDYGIKYKDEQLKDVDGLNSFKKDIKSIISKNDEEQYNKAKDEAMKSASQILNLYMAAFAGKDNFSKISSDSSMKMIDISDKVKGPNDKSLVSMFEVQPMSEQEKAKMVEQFKINYKEDPSKKNLNCKQKVCFVVKYTLNVDK